LVQNVSVRRRSRQELEIIMGITIAVLPDSVTQKQIFGEAQWKQGRWADELQRRLSGLRIYEYRFREGGDRDVCSLCDLKEKRPTRT
jgi:hypothetical protein